VTECGWTGKLQGSSYSDNSVIHLMFTVMSKYNHRQPGVEGYAPLHRSPHVTSSDKDPNN